MSISFRLLYYSVLQARKDICLKVNGSTLYLELGNAVEHRRSNYNFEKVIRPRQT